MKNVVITGSTRGIGFAMAKVFSKKAAMLPSQAEVNPYLIHSAKNFSNTGANINMSLVT